MRYFLQLSYKGTGYNGWQRQLNAPSIQQELEEKLSLILREQIQVTGSGRTDTGVHAAYYVCHFDAGDFPFRDPAEFVYKLNSVLPGDIVASNIQETLPEAHARFDALSREYRYFILPSKDPFLKELTWQYTSPLDIGKMNDAASMLAGEKEFTTFSKLHSGNKTGFCNVKKAVWECVDGTLVFTIRADRFLRNMVRSVVGTLVDVGRGKLTVDDFREALEARNRAMASSGAPAQGLYLYDIEYDKNIFDPAGKDRIRKFKP